MKKILLVFFVAIIGAFLAINLLGSFTSSVNVFDLEFSTKVLGRSATVINIPPFGKIVAHTHNLPVQLNITLVDIKPRIVEALLDNPITKDEFIAVLKQDVINAQKAYFIKLLALSFAGAAFLAIMFRYNIKYIMLSGLIGIVITFSMMGFIYKTYNYDAFMDPRYEGILEAAPWMMGMAQQTLASIDKLGEQIQVMTQNVNTLFSKINDIKPINDGEENVKILHVSDLHNNPAAFDLIEQTAKSFNIDFIIDTGDITDYGTPLETQLINRINTLKIPYIFIPGNHDSPGVISAMKALKNVIVLDDAFINLKGINVYGVSDPNSKSSVIETPDENAINQFAATVKQKLKNSSIKPDVIAVHNPAVGRHLDGIAEVVLSGHTHALSVEKTGSTVLINAGTTGAAGVRGLQSVKDVPYSEVLLYFKTDNNESLKKFLAADIIKVYNLNQKGLTLERFLNQ